MRGLGFGGLGSEAPKLVDIRENGKMILGPRTDTILTPAVRRIPCPPRFLLREPLGICKLFRNRESLTQGAEPWILPGPAGHGSRGGWTLHQCSHIRGGALQGVSTARAVCGDEAADGHTSLFRPLCSAPPQPGGGDPSLW